MNFGLFIFILLIFGKILYISNENNDFSNSFYIIDSKYFRLNEEAKHAEEMAVRLVKEQNTKHILRLKILLHIRRTNICHQSSEIKSEFCAKLQQVEYYGLQFNIDEYKNVKCKPQKFSLQYIPQTESNSYKLPMFACPHFFYIDLETNEKTPWMYQYYISESNERNSALIFSQKGSEELTYPRKYASQINFNILESYFRKEETYLHSFSKPKVSIFSKNQMDKDIYNYIRAKHIITPYQKFIQLFSSINICGLRRSHKIYMCRQAFEHFISYVELNFADFDEEKCKNHAVHFHSRIEFNLSPKNRLFVLHCSALLSAHIISKKEFNHYYISSKMEKDGFNMFTRVNKKAKKLVPKFYSQSSKTYSMIQDIRRKEVFPWLLPTQQTRQTYKKSKNDLEKELNKLKDGRNIPPILTKTKRLQSSVKIITKGLFVDDFIAAFSKIKNIKLVYRKFKMTYWSVDICKLGWRQKTNLCNDILEAPQYQFRRVLPISSYSCISQKILLNFRETENLLNNNFTMWPCPHFFDRTGKNFYFISKSHLKNAVIVFTSEENQYVPPIDYFYPEAVVIQSEKLATY